MRIIKLSPKDDAMRNREMVDDFFKRQLPGEYQGEFGFPKGFISKNEFHAGENVVFSYKKEVVFLASSKSGVLDQDPNDRNSLKYFEVDVSSVRPGKGSLERLEAELRKLGVLFNRDKAGRKIPKTILSKGWPKIEIPKRLKSSEDALIRSFEKKRSSPQKPLPAIEDLDPPAGRERPDRARKSHWTYERDPEVRDYVLRRAKGRCEYCRKRGFRLPSGHRFLETHHVIALAKEGADTVENVIALCPNHHREAHFGKYGRRIETKMIQLLKRMQCNRK